MAQLRSPSTLLDIDWLLKRWRVFSLTHITELCSADSRDMESHRSVKRRTHGDSHTVFSVMSHGGLGMVHTWVRQCCPVLSFWSACCGVLHWDRLCSLSAASLCFPSWFGFVFSSSMLIYLLLTFCVTNVHAVSSLEDTVGRFKASFAAERRTDSFTLHSLRNTYYWL